MGGSKETNLGEVTLPVKGEEERVQPFSVKSSEV